MSDDKALQRIYDMTFGYMYPFYVAKAERKGYSKRDVDKIIRWLTGYDQRQLMAQTRNEKTLENFFADAPAMNPNRSLITGVICGVRVEEVEEATMREIRYLDKLIDELTRGKKMESILRSG